MRPIKLAITATALLASNATAQMPETGTVVVTNKAANSASLIDIESGEIAATIRTGVGPHEVAVAPGGRWAVVTNYGQGRGMEGSSLTLIDIPAGEVERTVDLGFYTRPHGVVFLGDTMVAVTSEAARAVVLVDIPSGQPYGEVETRQGGSHMVTHMTPEGKAYTGNISDGSVSELDLFGMRHLRTIPVAPQAEAIQVSPSGDAVWVGSNSMGIVTVLDMPSGEVRGTLEGFTFPYRIAFSPSGNKAVIPDLRSNVVRVFDANSLEELGTIRPDGGGPQGIIVISERTALVSMSRSDVVNILDLENFRVTGSLPTGAAPDGIGISSMVVGES